MTQKQVLPAFVLVSNPTVRWPVSVQVPVDGGASTEYGFTGTFRVLSESDLAAALPARTEEDLNKRKWVDVLAENAECLPRVMVGWDVLDPDGRPVPIEHLPAALTGPHGKWLAAGIHQAILQIRLGLPARPPAIEGNSPTAPESGSAAQSDDPDPMSSKTT